MRIVLVCWWPGISNKVPLLGAEILLTSKLKQVFLFYSKLIPICTFLLNTMDVKPFIIFVGELN